MDGHTGWQGDFAKYVIVGGAKHSFKWNWAMRAEVGDHEFTQPSYELEAGEHTFYIAGRSKNFFLDRLVFYRALPLNDARDEALPPTPIEKEEDDEDQAAPEAVWPTVPTGPLPEGLSAMTGELKKWHKITLDLQGPECSETGDPNPFLDYRLNVIFSNGDTVRVVPGFFAADGDAANTSAERGNVWRCHFAPDKEGEWTYCISLRQGVEIAVDDKVDAGDAVAPLDMTGGTFTVAATDKEAPDLRAKGRLEYVGGHFLRFAETGDYFVKQGADSPENLFAYKDFDGVVPTGIKKFDSFQKTWKPHVGDWKDGDPTWQDGKGKGLIGALNYLASEGMNAISFLTMNIRGDDRNVFPYLKDDDFDRMDVSRLAQWEIVMEHADRLGLFLHFKTQERENQFLLSGGDLGRQRKLYYRELIARFSHHLALNWNLGEENTAQTTPQRKAMARYFRDTDPYPKRHIVIHNPQWPHDLLGPESELTGLSAQIGGQEHGGFDRIHDTVAQ